MFIDKVETVSFSSAFSSEFVPDAEKAIGNKKIQSKFVLFSLKPGWGMTSK